MKTRSKKPKKIIKKEKIPATLRNAIWATYISPINSTGYCCCCSIEPITKANFAAGHIVAEARGGAVTLQNLRPVCTLCNSSMGKTNMNEFIAKYGLAGPRGPEPLDQPLYLRVKNWLLEMYKKFIN